jgi:hypothetical protein
VHDIIMKGHLQSEGKEGARRIIRVTLAPRPISPRSHFSESRRGFVIRSHRRTIGIYWTPNKTGSGLPAC